MYHDDGLREHRCFLLKIFEYVILIVFRSSVKQTSLNKTFNKADQTVLDYLD